jgi:hypothetical protein
MGPYKVIKLVGKNGVSNAIKLDITGDKLLNHNVFHVASTKRCEKGTRFKKAVELTPGNWIVEEILNFRFHYGKPQWLVDFGGFSEVGTARTSNHYWTKLDDLCTANDATPIKKLIQFEESRTKLRDTLDTSWKYPNRKAGTTMKYPDGWTIYYTLKGDTMQSMARKLNVSASALFLQNVMAYAVGDERKSSLRGAGKLDRKRQFPAAEQFRLPKNASGHP